MICTKEIPTDMSLKTGALLRKIKYPFKQFNDLSTLVRGADTMTNYPDHPRKSKWQIARDLFNWLIRYREVNRYYYFYGLDRLSANRENEVMGLRDFRRLRDRPNQQLSGANFNYVALLRDKFVFGQFLSALGFPTPRNIAMLDQRELTWLDTMQTAALSALTDTKVNADGFCKPLAGWQGEGSFPLQVRDGRLYVRGSEITMEQLREKLDGIYLLQERIHQHPELSRLHPGSVNTLRMITVRQQSGVDLLCATQRIGTGGRSVDNFAAGGMIVSIDPQTGRLRGDALFKPGKGRRADRHPDSGIVLEGFQVPFFAEAVKLTTDLHRFFYGIRSIGWDIAITADGPVIVEGNDDWDGTLGMSLEKDFLQQFTAWYQR
jgi:hypothetical protein